MIFGGTITASPIAGLTDSQRHLFTQRLVQFEYRAVKMGGFKKEAARKERQGKNGGGLGNVKTKGENFYRYATAKAL